MPLDTTVFLFTVQETVYHFRLYEENRITIEVRDCRNRLEQLSESSVLKQARLEELLKTTQSQQQAQRQKYLSDLREKDDQIVKFQEEASIKFAQQKNEFAKERSRLQDVNSV